jgi:uncharacterized membrane protein YvbJ
MKVFSLLFIVVVLVATFSNISANFSNRRRRTKELEEKINKLDEGTKQRIYAMKASGMPKEAIAEKISYTTGGKGTAKRIVDALHDDTFQRPKQQKATTFTKKTTPVTPTSSTIKKNVNANLNTKPTTTSSSTANKNTKPTVGSSAFGKKK